MLFNENYLIFNENKITNFQRLYQSCNNKSVNQTDWFLRQISEPTLKVFDKLAEELNYNDWESTIHIQNKNQWVQELTSKLADKLVVGLNTNFWEPINNSSWNSERWYEPV